MVMTMPAQAPAIMMVVAMPTMMMAMICCTASAAKKNATKPRKEDMIEIDDSSSENLYVSSSSDDDKKLNSSVFAPRNSKENANAKNTSLPKKKKHCVHVLILISFQWTQQCQVLWCYVVSCDVIILQRALLILPCIIFESITPYLLVI